MNTLGPRIYWTSVSLRLNIVKARQAKCSLTAVSNCTSRRLIVYESRVLYNMWSECLLSPLLPVRLPVRALGELSRLIATSWSTVHFQGFENRVDSGWLLYIAVDTRLGSLSLSLQWPTIMLVGQFRVT